MKQSKLNWIINLIREEMMVANAPGTSGGFSGSGDPKIKAGFDPVMGLRRRKGPQIKLPPGSRKRWMRDKPTP